MSVKKELAVISCRELSVAGLQGGFSVLMRSWLLMMVRELI